MEAPNPGRSLPIEKSHRQRRRSGIGETVEKAVCGSRARLRKAELDAWQTSIKTVFVGGGGISG